VRHWSQQRRSIASRKLSSKPCTGYRRVRLVSANIPPVHFPPFASCAKPTKTSRLLPLSRHGRVHHSRGPITSIRGPSSRDLCWALAAGHPQRRLGSHARGDGQRSNPHERGEPGVAGCLKKHFGCRAVSLFCCS